MELSREFDWKKKYIIFYVLCLHSRHFAVRSVDSFPFFHSFFFPSSETKFELVLLWRFYVFVVLGRTADIISDCIPSCFVCDCFASLLVVAFLVFMYGLAFVAVLRETVDC